MASRRKECGGAAVIWPSTCPACSPVCLAKAWAVVAGLARRSGHHAEHVGRGLELKRIALGVEHGGPVRERGHHGQPLARPQVRVDDARRPHDLPVAADPAQAEVASIGPHASLLGEVDRGREGRLRGAAVLDDRLHGQEQLRRVELRDSSAQVRGHGVRRGRGQRARGGVLLLLPGEQERLRGGFGRKFRAEAGGQADDQDADGHDGDARRYATRFVRRVAGEDLRPGLHPSWARRGGLTGSRRGQPGGPGRPGPECRGDLRN